jgi:hypothetical protein
VGCGDPAGSMTRHVTQDATWCVSPVCWSSSLQSTVYPHALLTPPQQAQQAQPTCMRAWEFGLQVGRTARACGAKPGWHTNRAHVGAHCTEACVARVGLGVEDWDDAIWLWGLLLAVGAVGAGWLWGLLLCCVYVQGAWVQLLYGLGRPACSSGGCCNRVDACAEWLRMVGGQDARRRGGSTLWAMALHACLHGHSWKHCVHGVWSQALTHRISWRPPPPPQRGPPCAYA